MRITRIVQNRKRKKKEGKGKKEGENKNKNKAIKNLLFKETNCVEKIQEDRNEINLQ